MSTKVIMLILLIIGVLEIFFNIISNLLQKIIGLFNENFQFKEKTAGILKLIFVIIFMVSVIFFLTEFVRVLAALFGISLDNSILDIFK
ncbi:hypothetical protein DW1_2355 [Proteiniborus sp. DW1]|uniref:hypothetical protein n=1 Tax=Proteiniborus sp. DW1 TaxID=1889883 RepID=UPI00092E1C10|nr:hypothetical protein [Proteiniborus sp. DW1]SCG83919.1 hypothetical protein DW1_2355 [Proteiniborus sp. DW1]